MTTLPPRRNDDLEIVELPEETLVYDLTRYKAYCLNRTAALVWKGCDGRTTTGEMAYILQAETGMRGDDEMIAYALEQLGKAGLLAGPLPAIGGGGRLARRDFLLRLALFGAGVALLPTVASVLAPTPAQAAHSPGCVTVSVCQGGAGANNPHNCRHCGADVGECADKRCAQKLGCTPITDPGCWDCLDLSSSGCPS